MLFLVVSTPQPGIGLAIRVAPVQRVKHDTLSRCCSRFGENIRLSSYVS